MKLDPRFDPVGGMLRLTRAALADMCASVEGREVGDRAALSSAGLIQGERLHPRLVPVAETAARPLARFNLDVAGKSPVHSEGWVGEDFALLLAARSATEHVFEATFVSRSMLPSQLARFVGLGPRVRGKVSDPVEVDQGLLEALLGGGDPFSPSQVEMLIDPQDQLEPSWVEALSALSAGVSARWRAGVWWNSFEESPEARSLEIIDSSSGLFFVSHAVRGGRRFARVRLRPVTPSQVWRLLCALVPRPGEVAEPLSPWDGTSSG